MIEKVTKEEKKRNTEGVTSKKGKKGKKGKTRKIKQRIMTYNRKGITEILKEIKEILPERRKNKEEILTLSVSY